MSSVIEHVTDDFSKYRNMLTTMKLDKSKVPKDRKGCDETLLEILKLIDQPQRIRKVEDCKKALQKKAPPDKFDVYCEYIDGMKVVPEIAEQKEHDESASVRERQIKLEKAKKSLSIAAAKTQQQPKNAEKKLKKQQQSISSAKEAIERHFLSFLQSANMEQYAQKFHENDCFDMQSIDFFDDEMLRDELGIKKTAPRKRFLRKREEMKKDMDAFRNLKAYGISKFSFDQLSQYGVVTARILSHEVEQEEDLRTKFEIDDAAQRSVLWGKVQHYKTGGAAATFPQQVLVDDDKKEEDSKRVVRNALVLLIGVSEYNGKPYKTLPGVVVDMQRHRKLWEDVYKYRVLPEKNDQKWFGKREWSYYDIEEFVQEKRHELLDVDNQLVHDALFVVVSGHGVLQGVIPSDYDKDDKANNTPVTYKGMQLLLSNWKKSIALSIPRIFMVDACRGSQPGGDVELQYRGITGHVDQLLCTVYGNSPGIKVKESPDGGMFTQCLLSQLSKAQDGKTTLSDIASKTNHALKKDSGHYQQVCIEGDPDCNGITFRIKK